MLDQRIPVLFLLICKQHLSKTAKKKWFWWLTIIETIIVPITCNFLCVSSSCILLMPTTCKVHKDKHERYFFTITSTTYLHIILVHHDGIAWYLVLFAILVFLLNWYQSFCIHQWMGYSCNGQIPSGSEALNLCILYNQQYLNTKNNKTKKRQMRIICTIHLAYTDGLGYSCTGQIPLVVRLKYLHLIQPTVP